MPNFAIRMSVASVCLAAACAGCAGTGGRSLDAGEIRTGGAEVQLPAGTEIVVPWTDDARVWEGTFVVAAGGTSVSVLRPDGEVQIWRGIEPAYGLQRGSVLRSGSRLGRIVAGRRTFVQASGAGRRTAPPDPAGRRAPTPASRAVDGGFVFSSPGGIPFAKGAETMCRGRWEEAARTKVRRASLSDGGRLDVSMWTDVHVHCLGPEPERPALAAASASMPNAGAQVLEQKDGQTPAPGSAQAAAALPEPVMADPEPPLPPSGFLPESQEAKAEAQASARAVLADPAADPEGPEAVLARIRLAGAGE